MAQGISLYYFLQLFELYNSKYIKSLIREENKSHLFRITAVLKDKWEQ